MRRVLAYIVTANPVGFVVVAAVAFAIAAIVIGVSA